MTPVSTIECVITHACCFVPQLTAPLHHLHKLDTKVGQTSMSIEIASCSRIAEFRAAALLLASMGGKGALRRHTLMRESMSTNPQMVPG